MKRLLQKRSAEMDLNMALFRCQQTCFRQFPVKQTVSLRARIAATSCDETPYRRRKLTVCFTKANLTIQRLKPYHGLFEKWPFGWLY
jgi:hypothetical protein